MLTVQVFDVRVVVVVADTSDEPEEFKSCGDEPQHHGSCHLHIVPGLCDSGEWAPAYQQLMRDSH